MDKTKLKELDISCMGYPCRKVFKAVLEIVDKVFPDEEPDIRKTWAASAGEELGRAPYCSVRTCSNFAITTIKYDDFRCIDLCLDCAESLKAVAKEGAKTATVDDKKGFIDYSRLWDERVKSQQPLFRCVACNMPCKSEEMASFLDDGIDRSFPMCNHCRNAMCKAMGVKS